MNLSLPKLIQSLKSHQQYQLRRILPHHESKVVVNELLICQ